MLEYREEKRRKNRVAEVAAACFTKGAIKPQHEYSV
jgi:hypothetical protein